MNTGKNLGGRDGNRRNSFHQHHLMSSAMICRLRNREIFGVCNKSRTHCYGGGKRVLLKLPRRFAVPLTSLVNDATLYTDAHIFLGFSSCDKFLISYTENIQEASHTGFLSHVYTLHWWIFNPGSEAEKVGSVRLFANEEIEYSLCLCYAEWPNLKSQIIIYGWRKASESCYITIAAVPSVQPCKMCNVQTPSTNDIDSSDDLACHARCINHGFAMHFKQASGTSASGVLNRSGLKIDGILVLNIGHSIAVISTGIFSNKMDSEKLPLSSIKRSACEESVTDSDLVEALQNDSQQEEPLQILYKEPPLLKKRNDIYNSKEIYEKASNLLNAKTECARHSCQFAMKDDPTSVYDIDSDDSDIHEHITLIKKIDPDIENKENIKGKLKVSDEVMTSKESHQMEFEVSLNTDPYFDPEPKSIVLGRVNVNFTETNCEFVKGNRCTSNLCEESSEYISNCDDQNCASILLHSDNYTSEPNCDHINCAKDFTDFKPSKCTFPQNTSMQTSSEIEGNTSKFIPENRCTKRNKTAFLSPVTKTSSVMALSMLNKVYSNLENSRSELNFVTPSPTASDGSSSVHCSVESHLFQNGSKKGRNSDGLVSFSENFYGPIRQETVTPDDPLPAGESSLFYCSMFCQGAAEQMLHPLEKCQCDIQAYSQHLVLDLEHVIFDILRTRCYMAYKYGYLVDYEANVLDVSSDSKSVIVHIVALLNVALHRQRPLSEIVSGVDNKGGAVMQQAEFILSWQLHTGRYEVVMARPLKSYDERVSGVWSGEWIVKMGTSMKQQCAVRSNPYRSVYILDNSSVFRHQSLNILWNCDKTFAVTK